MVGIAAIFSDEVMQFGGQTLTANIVTMAVLGALTMYIISMLALFRLRQREPELARPFRAPCYPWFPGFAVVAALLALCAIVAFNPGITAIYLVMLGVGYLYFLMTPRQRESSADPHPGQLS